jgi:hypothetical protein
VRARIADFLYIGPKRGRLTLDLYGDFRSQFDQLNGKELFLKLEPYSEPRSKDANAYCWVLIHRIAEKMREAPVEVYRGFIRDFSCKTTVVCVKEEDAAEEIRSFVEGHIGRLVDIGDSKIPGCVLLHKKYGSSSFSKEQMTAFIDIIVDQCRELEIETKNPEEIESLLKGWEK